MTFEQIFITYITPIVGLLTLAITATSCLLSHRDQIKNNELSGRPDFYFTKPNGCSRFGVSECSEGPFSPTINMACNGEQTIYWFNMVNYGRFVAEDVKIMIATQSEITNITDIARNWIKIPFWGGMPSQSTYGNDGELIPIETKWDTLRLKQSDRKLYTLIEYTSSYSNKRYKKIFEWCLSDYDSEETLKDWGIAIAQRVESDDEGIKSHSNNQLLESQIGKNIVFRNVRTYGATEKQFWKTTPRFFIKLHAWTSKKVSAREWLEIY